MRRRRAAAALYVMVMLIIMTSVTLAYASLSNSAVSSETRREQAVIAKLAIDGATLKAAYDAGIGTVSTTSINVETVGHYNCAVNMSDNSTNLAHSLSMSSAIVIKGSTYSDTRVTALKMPFSQFFYALAINSDYDTNNNIYAGSSGSNGDIYCDGRLRLRTGFSIINGDVECTGPLDTSHAAVTGLATSGALSIPLPNPNSSDYSSVAQIFLLNFIFGNNISDHTFFTPYSVIYCNGNTNISGLFVGKGVIFVHGNVDVYSDISYLSPTDELTIISTGNVQIHSNVNNIVGYWDAGTTFQTMDDLNVPRGAIVANSLSLGGNLTINYDSTIWNTPGEAANMKLPGFWP